MFNKNILYTLTILEAIEKIKIYIKEFDNADNFLLANDQLNFNATVNLLIAIGEEAKNIDEAFKKKYQNINWKAVVGLRNELAHNYRGIDADIVWDITQNYLDNLMSVCKNYIKEQLELKNMRLDELEKIISTSYYKHLHYLKSLISPI